MGIKVAFVLRATMSGRQAMPKHTKAHSDVVRTSPDAATDVASSALLR